MPSRWPPTSEAHLVSVSCTKRHANTSSVLVAPAHETPARETTYAVRTAASSQTKAYKKQVRAAVVGAGDIPAGPVQLHLAFVRRPATRLAQPMETHD